MKARGAGRLPFLLLAACLGAAVPLCLEWEAKLAGWQRGMDVFRNQSSEDEEEDDDSEEEQAYAPTVARNESGVGQKISAKGGVRSAQYNFINFNKDRLTVNFGMNDAEFGDYMKGYGYTDAELAALKDWRKSARTEAWNKAVAQGGQAAGERAIAGIDMDYDTKLRGLLRSRGMALREGNTVECDMPLVVKRNVKVMQPLAIAIQTIGKQRRYASDDMMGAVLSLVQTAIRYKIPPLVEGTLHTGGLLPPARTMLSGWGDCDTKTGLAASILGNWNLAKMVGISVPGHYLMAVRRLPGKGDMFVRYEGLEYVLVEPAGPAWLEPGQVGQFTKDLLKSGKEYQIEPFLQGS